MSTSDYEIHLDPDRFNSLWGDREEADEFPFGEDDAALEKLIEEELGPSRKRARPGSRRRT